jgi:hypothetical protein
MTESVAVRPSAALTAEHDSGFAFAAVTALEQVYHW